MGKRKSSANHEKSEPVLKKEVKTLDSSDNESENDADETAVSINYEPDKMRLLIDSFTEFVEKNDSIYKCVSNLEKMVTEWVDSRKDDKESVPVDITTFCADYKKYMKLAIKFTNLHISDCSKLTLKFLNDPKCLKHFKDFPRAPSKPINVYMKMKQISAQVKDMKVVYDTFKNETPDVTEKVKKEVFLEQERRLEEMKKFLQNHPLLTFEQVSHLESKIKSVSKRLHPNTVAQRTPAKKKKEAPTPFSLWCRSKALKYADLPEEERMAKLEKKFKKISDAELRLLEDLAMTV
ncbi:unnamed protein product [Caenorhabditis bovis]|uniref:Uncharacterized protein n=1 Tax=Caenorhabditis bovis TaxID=2654633 RepID=A0A8S1E0X9_9PELO|nr:unnamed protein product [Caenorhabditis bovis]